MAYCRWSKDSDLYMYHSSFGYVFDLNKSLIGGPGKYFMVKTDTEAEHRMVRMKRQGYKIPMYAILRIQTEVALRKGLASPKQ